MAIVRTLVLAVVVFAVARYAFCLRHNIAEAKRSRLPYIVVPWSTTLPFWEPVYDLLVPIVITWLPERQRQWWMDRIDLMKPNFVLRTKMGWFDRLGDVFLIVSPSLILLNDANAEANHWFLSRREQFPKWVYLYRPLAVFGPNILTTEGAEWRHHRRLIASSFNEANAALVFAESIKQARSMLEKWLDGKTEEEEANSGKSDDKLLMTAHEDSTKWSLHIIGYVGFGLRLLWPGETPPANVDARMTKYASLNAPPGFKVSFVDAMAGVLEHVFLVVIFPTWLLCIMPFKVARETGRAAQELLKYMNDLLDEGQAKVSQHETLGGADKEMTGMDVLGHLAQTGSGPSGLSRDAMIGNAFVLQLAGHETTANSLHFTLVYLACFPAAQRKVQRDIDSIVGDSDPSTWKYTEVVNALLGSMVGAAMHESLRLLPSVTVLPKLTSQDQPLVVKGKEYTVPKGTGVFVGVFATHRNPRYWPTQPSRFRPGETDIEDFVPERWYRSRQEDGKDTPNSDASGSEKEAGEIQDESFGDTAGPMLSSDLFRPVKGAYLPFAEGARSCLGRRFAQAEIMAALAVIFQKHSIELQVEDDASEAEAGQAGESEGEKERGRKLYMKARGEALEVLAKPEIIPTVKMAAGRHIWLRIAPRGKSRFASWMD